jgi:hypothetical protein
MRVLYVVRRGPRFAFTHDVAVILLKTMDTTHTSPSTLARGAPWNATQLPRARCAHHPLHWYPLVPARVFRTAVLELVNRILCPGTATRQDCLNPGVLWRQGHSHPVNDLLRARPSRCVAGLLPQLVVALPVIPENFPPSGYGAARKYAHDEVRARLGVVAISFNHARLCESVCDVRGARLVGGRGGVPSEADLARTNVDVRSNDDTVRVPPDPL